MTRPEIDARLQEAFDLIRQVVADADEKAIERLLEKLRQELSEKPPTDTGSVT